jgi:hypothetical protein
MESSQVFEASQEGTAMSWPIRVLNPLSTIFMSHSNNYNSDWTPLLAGRSPAGMAARFAARSNGAMPTTLPVRPQLPRKLPTLPAARFLGAKILRTESYHFDRSEVGLGLATETSAVGYTGHLFVISAGCPGRWPARPSQHLGKPMDAP